MNVRTTASSKSPIGNKTLTAILTAVAVLALMLGVRAAGAPQSQDKPTQVGSVDFMVVNATGEPVTDLKPEEVTLRIDGKIRPIKTLRFVKVTSGMTGAAVAAAAAPTAPATDAMAPAFVTNLAAVAAVPRSIILIVDDESMPIGQEQKIRSMLSNFVSNLPPADQVALVTVPHGGIKVGLTTDRDRLRSGISEISPISPMADLPCRTRDTLSTLGSTIDLLARSSEQPVVVAFLSASLSGISQAEAARPASIAGGGVSSQGGSCYLTPDDFKRVGTSVAESRVQLFIIHPDYSLAPALEGIENLRGQTGAPLFHLSAGTEPGLYRMARETSGYYVATFDTDPDERVGVSHVSNIRTTRKDVDLRGRPYLLVGRATPPPDARAISSGPTNVTTAFDMVRSGRAFTDLPLRATASSSRNPDGNVNVIGLFEPVDPSAKIMTAAAALIDENGKGIAYWTGEADKLKTWPMAVGLVVPPGKYRMRIGAIDASGRTGLVDYNIVAELPAAGPLQMSGLLLGVSRGTFTPRLQFSTEASAVAYLELYGGKEGTRVGVIFEVSRTTNGPAMLQVGGSLSATSEEGKFTVTGTIPVGALDPGDYVVRAIVGVTGQAEGRVVRTLHKAG